MLCKLFSEEVENIDLGPNEALKTAGANSIQTLWYANIIQNHFTP
jgi:phosphonate transport system permease protein